MRTARSSTRRNGPRPAPSTTTLQAAQRTVACRSRHEQHPISFTGTDKESEDTVVLDPTTPRTDRAVFLSDELEKAVRVSGTGKVSVRVKVNKVAAGIKARLVDYGTATRYVNVTNVPNTRVCWGDGNALDTGCYAEDARSTRRSPTRPSWSARWRTSGTTSRCTTRNRCVRHVVRPDLRAERRRCRVRRPATGWVWCSRSSPTTRRSRSPARPSRSTRPSSSLTLPLTGNATALNHAEAPQARIPATRLAQPEPEKDPVKLMRQFEFVAKPRARQEMRGL